MIELMLFASLVALGGDDGLIIPDEEDLDFTPDLGDCTISKQCEGQPGRICEITADEDVTPDLEKMTQAFTEGLGLYRGRRFEEALKAFENALGFVPGDGPSRVFSERCRWFSKNPPLESWDGVFTMKTK